jgi:hypothetical protein
MCGLETGTGEECRLQERGSGEGRGGWREIGSGEGREGARETQVTGC